MSTTTPATVQTITQALDDLETTLNQAESEMPSPGGAQVTQQELDDLYQKIIDLEQQLQQKLTGSTAPVPPTVPAASSGLPGDQPPAGGTAPAAPAPDATTTGSGQGTADVSSSQAPWMTGSGKAGGGA